MSRAAVPVRLRAAATTYGHAALWVPWLDRLVEPDQLVGEQRPPHVDLGHDRGPSPTARRRARLGRRRRRSVPRRGRRARAKPTPRSWSASARPGARRRVGRQAGGEVRGHDERARTDRDERVRAPVQAPCEGVVGEGAIRIHAANDDLGDRVRLDEVDPLEGGHDGALRDAEWRDRRAEPDVAAPLGGHPIGRRAAGGPAPAGCRTAPGHRELVRTTGARPLRRPGVPLRRRRRRPIVHAVGQLATDRHLDPEQVEPGRRRGPRPRRGPRRDRARTSVVPSHGRGASPSRSSSSRRATRSASMRSTAMSASRRASASARPATVGLAQQLGLEGEVDGARRDVERELLRVEVVLEQGHRERQGDAAAQPVPGARQPAVDGRAGQRPAGPVETRHAEQAQQRALLAERGRRAGAGAPGTGQGRRPVSASLSIVLSSHSTGSIESDDGQEAAERGLGIVAGEPDRAVADALGAGHDRGVVGDDPAREVDLDDDRRPDRQRATARRPRPAGRPVPPRPRSARGRRSGGRRSRCGPRRRS